MEVLKKSKGLSAYYNLYFPAANFADYICIIPSDPVLVSWTTHILWCFDRCINDYVCVPINNAVYSLLHAQDFIFNFQRIKMINLYN